MSLTDARWIDIRHNDDARGTLTALEGDELPFPVRRIFYMHRVPQGGERGAHAHRYTQQCLIAVAGAFSVDLSDGAATATYVLDDPNRGLYLPVMTWAHLPTSLLPAAGCTSGAGSSAATSNGSRSRRCADGASSRTRVT